MPLQLEPDRTERPKRVVWDPAEPAQAAEAQRERAGLLARGFILRMEAEGEALFDPPQLEEYHLVMRTLSQNGDDRIVWDRRDGKQVREAATKFNTLVKAGYTMYAAGRGGKRSHKMEIFDPTVEEIIAVPGTVPG